MEELLKASAVRLAAAVRGRDISPVELVEGYAERIERIDPALNAVVIRDLDQAREDARRAEEALARRGVLPPLHGVPFTAKDAIESAGLPCTNGSRLYEGRVPQRDAPAIRNLRRAGAILIGKTNVPEFCIHYDTVNDLYGATRNPHDRSRSAGGSSGGEGAAVAAALTGFGVGSDLAGSIRLPAHWDGVFGMRPSRGRVPVAGHAFPAYPPSFELFATIGPMARSAADLALLLEAMAGLPLPPTDSARVRIAVFEEDGLQPVAAICREAARRAAEVLARAGHELVEARPPGQAEIREAFDALVLDELAMAIVPELAAREDELSAYGRGFLEEMRERETDLERAVRMSTRLVELARSFDDWLDEHPLAVCPVAPTPAAPLGEGITEIDGEPARPGGKLTLCSIANTLGLPAASVPVVRSPEGLPVGAQVLGRRGYDTDVIAAACELERAFGGSLDPDDAPRSATRTQTPRREAQVRLAPLGQRAPVYGAGGVARGWTVACSPCAGRVTPTPACEPVRVRAGRGSSLDHSATRVDWRRVAPHRPPARVRASPPTVSRRSLGTICERPADGR